MLGTQTCSEDKQNNTMNNVYSMQNYPLLTVAIVWVPVRPV